MPDDDPTPKPTVTPSADTTPMTAPTSLTRRELLRAGTRGTVSFAAAASAPALPAGRRLDAQDPTPHDSSTAHPADSTAAHASHDQMNAVGDLAPDSYSPTHFLTDFDTGRISILPSGQTLREYDIVAEDRNIEV